MTVQNILPLSSDLLHSFWKAETGSRPIQPDVDTAELSSEALAAQGQDTIGSADALPGQGQSPA